MSPSHCSTTKPFDIQQIEATMRGSYIQPSHQNNQQAFPHNLGMEESTNYFRENRKLAISSHGSEKKESHHETKKLERMPTEDVNAKADAFIKNFRHHLLLQRLQSIENYEQRLARGL